MSSAQPDVLLKEIESGRFLRSRDSETVALLGRIFDNELEHLKLASPTVESGANKSQMRPRTGSGLKSPSWNLCQKEYSEINRTMLSALSLKWILRGDYDNFTSPQSTLTKLSLTTFNELREYFLQWLPKPEDTLDLIVALITSDLGKDPKVAEDLESKGLLSNEDANHDVITYTAAVNGHFPTFNQLPKERQEDILLGLKFAAYVNIPQLVQAECAPGNLKDALILKNRPRALGLKCMEILLDVAGAFGHRDTRGALTMTESVVGGYKATFVALSKLLEEQITMRQCYDSVLEYRRDLLLAKDFKFTLPDLAQDRAYLRLLCIGRVEDSQLAEIFLDAYKNLDPRVHEALVSGLNVDGIDDGTAILPYYMPGLCSVALTSRDQLSTITQRKIVESLFRFLTRVLGGTKPMPGQEGHILERNLAFARFVIGSDEFLENPKTLDDLPLPFPPISEGIPNGQAQAPEQPSNGA